MTEATYTTEIIAPASIEASLPRVSELLRNDGIVGMPTETVYGLAGNAFSPKAIASVFNAKERPSFDPLIVHAAHWSATARADEELSRQGIIERTRLSKESVEVLNTLARIFWPGPLTLVLPKSDRIPELATSGLQTVAVRVPRHPLAQKLIRAAGIPLVAPSANRFGRISPTTAEAVLEELNGRIPLILDGGPCDIGLESTVIRIEPDASLTLLRPGGTSPESVEEAIQRPLKRPLTPHILPNAPGSSPGMLASHYAPSKRLLLLPASVSEISRELLDSQIPLLNAMIEARTIGLLLVSGRPKDASAKLHALLPECSNKSCIITTLSEEGDLFEAAHNLFARLRELDHSSAELLLAEPCHSQQGLGHAIADRLQRASHR